MLKNKVEVMATGRPKRGPKGVTSYRNLEKTGAPLETTRDKRRPPGRFARSADEKEMARYFR